MSLEEDVKDFIDHKRALGLKVSEDATPFIRILVGNVELGEANLITMRNAFRIRKTEEGKEVIEPQVKVLDKQFFKSLIEKEFPSLKKELQELHVRDIYEWSTHLTTESREEGWIKDYYWPEAVKRLLFKLKTVRGALIGLIGLQGTGKTGALKVLESEMWKVTPEEKWTLQFKWRPLESLQNIFQDRYFDLFTETFEDTLRDKIECKGISLNVLRKKVAGKRGMAAEDVGGRSLKDFFSDELATVLTQKEIKEAKREAQIHILRNSFAVFIDCPDYSRSDLRLMNRDLNDLQNLWDQIQPCNCNFVICIQKEMFRGHFFFGKMDVVELGQFKPEQLIEAYKQKWKDVYPFTENALQYLATVSQGVFRRFLRYIQLCIETWMIKDHKPERIEHKLATEVITAEQVLKDMSLELSDIFPKKEKRFLASKILTILSKLSMEETVNQKQLASMLDVNEMTISRVLDVLEAHEYLIRKRTKKQKMVTLSI